MKQLIRKCVRACLFAMLISVAVGFLPSASSQTPSSDTANLHARYVAGQSQAEVDVKAGVYVIKSWGLDESRLGGACDYPSPSEIKTRILSDKYKIKFESVGGCIISDSDAEFARGYNETVERAINAKYGEDVFEKAEADAAQVFHDKYRGKERACIAWQEEIRKLPIKKP